VCEKYVTTVVQRVCNSSPMLKWRSIPGLQNKSYCYNVNNTITTEMMDSQSLMHVESRMLQLDW